VNISSLPDHRRLGGGDCFNDEPRDEAARAAWINHHEREQTDPLWIGEEWIRDSWHT
jgi:hypothetical protein